MRTDNRKPLLWPLLACIPLLLILTACGAGRNATPTLGLDAISTSAYMTFSAEMATKLALTPPTNTPSPSPFPTLPPLSPPATISFASSTPLAAVNTDCNRADWMADVTIPDKTRLDPGQKFAKTWLVQNSGTCTWNTDYKISFVDGLEMSGTDGQVSLSVAPGTQVEMTVNLRAPTSPGDYYGRWRMETDKDHPFGDYLTVVIKVIPLEATAP
ncbi:MAG: NBR1-Ig-like domain-containing protein [Chloroflexota bacterium]